MGRIKLNNDWYEYLNSDEYQPFKDTKTKKQMDKEDIEKIAALEHERYVIAATAFLEQIKKDYKTGVFRNVPEMLDWYRFRYNNMWKDYTALSETKKSYGRNWARRILEELKK